MTINVYTRNGARWIRKNGPHEVWLDGRLIHSVYYVDRRRKVIRYFVVDDRGEYVWNEALTGIVTAEARGKSVELRPAPHFAKITFATVEGKP